MSKTDFDAIVVGSGPNGLATAITMQQEGLSVLVIESKATTGGGLRTAELTLPGFKHDVCSAIHPLAVASPFFSTLPLDRFGLEYIHPDIAAAHPFDDGSAAVIGHSIADTAQTLGADRMNYHKLLGPVVNDWPKLAKDILGPIHFPEHPVLLAKFGLKAMMPATLLSRTFDTRNARALFAGMAAHSIQPLSNIATSAVALVLMAAAHRGGWPVAKGGSQSIATALEQYFLSMGGKMETGFHVQSLQQLPSSKAILFDITPRQLLEIAGHRFSSLYRYQLNKFRYGAGVFKVDWALDDQTPFTAPSARRAGTVHLGNTLEEIAAYEKMIWKNKVGNNPFVLFAQQSIADPSRAPQGKHTAWAYCHVPHGYGGDMTNIIERQVERFAPGFRDRIIGRHVMNVEKLEEYNHNYIGGDINGGVLDICQLFTRPALRYSPYRTSRKGLYICSSSTPPGGGVHGMCGYHAAKTALKDIFKIKARQL